MCVLLGGGLQNKGEVAGVILLVVTFLVVTVKRWLKSVYIYIRKLSQIKTGFRFFGPPCIT